MTSPRPSSLRRKNLSADASQWVLAGFRQNGMLAYRPLSGKLQEAELCTPFFKEMPQGFARLRFHGLEPNFSWLQEAGRFLFLATAAAQELLDWDVSHGDKNSAPFLKASQIMEP